MVVPRKLGVNLYGGCSKEGGWWGFKMGDIEVEVLLKEGTQEGNLYKGDWNGWMW